MIPLGCCPWQPYTLTLYTLCFSHCKPNYISLIRTRDAFSPPHCSPQSLLLFHLFLREAAFLPPPLHSLMTCFPHGNDFFSLCSHSLFIKSWCRFFKKNPHILFSPAPTVQSPALSGCMDDTLMTATQPKPTVFVTTSTAPL